MARLAPRLDRYDSGEQMTIPATYTSLTGDDFYVLLIAWEQVDLSSATIKIYYNPLINWVWGGGIFLAIGALLAIGPPAFGEERRTVSIPVRQTPSISVPQ
jgi:cytochrome c-type biogenesis protein CcmF